MKLKMYIGNKTIYVAAEFAKDFINELNNVCVRAAAQEKESGHFVDFKPLALELRAD